MYYTEIEILERVKELLWDGKDGSQPKDLSRAYTTVFICHVLGYILQSEMDGKLNEAFINVKDAVAAYCDGDYVIAYETVLHKFGVISACASYEEIQNHRFMLVDQIINAYKEGVSWAIPAVK